MPPLDYSIVPIKTTDIPETDLMSGVKEFLVNTTTEQSKVIAKEDVRFPASQITNDSAVDGATTKDALNTLDTAKAADNSVVHLTGNETVAGVKTFSSSPIVPNPTTATQADNKGSRDAAISEEATLRGNADTSIIADVKAVRNNLGYIYNNAITAGSGTYNLIGDGLSIKVGEKIMINIDSNIKWSRIIVCYNSTTDPSKRFIDEYVSKKSIELTVVATEDISSIYFYMTLSGTATVTTKITTKIALDVDELKDKAEIYDSYINSLTENTYNLFDRNNLIADSGVSVSFLGSNTEIKTTSNGTYKGVKYASDDFEVGEKYLLRCKVESFSGNNPCLYFRLLSSNGTTYEGFSAEPSSFTAEQGLTIFEGFATVRANCVGARIFITTSTSSDATFVLSDIMIAKVDSTVDYIPNITAVDEKARMDAKDYTDRKTVATRSSFAPRKPRVTFIDDDGYTEFYTHLVPIMETYGIPICAAYPADIVPTMRENVNFMTLEQCKKIEELGGEILVHGSTNLTTMTLADAEANVLKSKNALEYLGFKNTNIYVYPESGNNEQIRSMISKHFDGAIKTASPQNYKRRCNADCIPHYFIHRSSCGGYYDDSVPEYPSNTASIEYFQALVDEAINENGWLVFMSHSWMMPENSTWRNDPAHPERAYEGLDEFELMEQIIQYIQLKKSLGIDIEIVGACEGFELFRNVVQAGDYLGDWNENTSLHTTKGFAINKVGQFDYNESNRIIHI
jgi:peptidoglycan/xylan/chitin deacetylase (PgdA/CDA1 family)